jgi:hypothetical protein
LIEVPKFPSGTHRAQILFAPKPEHDLRSRVEIAKAGSCQKLLFFPLAVREKKIALVWFSFCEMLLGWV